MFSRECAILHRTSKRALGNNSKQRPWFLKFLLVFNQSKPKRFRIVISTYSSRRTSHKNRLLRRNIHAPVFGIGVNGRAFVSPATPFLAGFKKKNQRRVRRARADARQPAKIDVFRLFIMILLCTHNLLTLLRFTSTRHCTRARTQESRRT